MIPFVCGIVLGLCFALYGTRRLRGRAPLWTEIVVSGLSFAVLLAAFVLAWNTYRAAYSACLLFGLLSVVLLVAAARLEAFMDCIRTRQWSRGAENLFVLLTAAGVVRLLHRGIFADWNVHVEELLCVVVAVGALAFVGGACETIRRNASPFRLRAALFVSHLGLATMMCFPVSWFGPSHIDASGVVSLAVGAFLATCAALLIKLGLLLEAERTNDALSVK